jgi:hypothetical protein
MAICQCPEIVLAATALSGSFRGFCGSADTLWVLLRRKDPKVGRRPRSFPSGMDIKFPRGGGCVFRNLASSRVTDSDFLFVDNISRDLCGLTPNTSLPVMSVILC